MSAPMKTLLFIISEKKFKVFMAKTFSSNLKSYDDINLIIIYIHQTGVGILGRMQ